MSTAVPVHVYQLDGSAWGPSACMGAVGAMALDAYTGGAIRVGQAAIRAAQSDRSGGIGLDDVAEAWRKGWGLAFEHGPASWSTIRARLANADGVAITANYGALGSWRAPGSSFRGAHALYLRRLELAYTGQQAPAPGVVVDDPLRRSSVTIPESVVRLAYTGGAGWGKGVYANLASTPQLPGFASLVTFPVGHKLTRADVSSIMATLTAAGWFGSSVPGVELFARGTVESVLLRHVGDSWDKALQDRLSAELGAAATAANPANTLLAGLGDTLTRSALLLGLVALGLLGVFLTFREPVTLALPAPARRFVR